MKVLIIQTAFTGDVILATPLIEKLNQFYPQAQIDFLLKKGNESLFHQHPILNKVLIFNKKEGKIKQLFSLIKQIRAQQYDYVINLHRFFSSGLMAACSGATHKIGFDKNPFSFCYTFKKEHVIDEKSSFIHEIDRNLALIQHLTDHETVKPKLYPSKADFEQVKSKNPYVCIAPASVWFTKQFPVHKWVELINLIPPHYTINLLGGPTDKGLCENIQSKSTHGKVVVLAGELSFLASAALMQHAQMNFVNDSAPLHMASATNAPVVGIFCSTVPGFGFTPVADQSFIIETSEKLSCRPCGLHGYKACPESHFKCADLDVAGILSNVNLLRSC
jgi:heptosyltransferase-2